MNDLILERLKWLNDMNKTENDVLMTPDGEEYITTEIECGSPLEDDYVNEYKKVFLPKHLQNLQISLYL